MTTPVSIPGTSASSDRLDLGSLPVRTILRGLSGVVMVAAGGIGAAAIPMPDKLLDGTVFSWVRYGHGKELATAVLYAGLLMLVWAWIELGRAVRAKQVGRRGVLVAIAAWTVPLLFAPALFSRDLYLYLAQGDLGLHGFNPYTNGVSVLNDTLSHNVDAIWQNTPAPYGPMFMLIVKGVVLFTGQHVEIGLILLRCVFCTGLVLLCWALPRLATALGGDPVVALWFGAANPLVLAYLVGGGHNDLLMVGLLAAGAVFVIERRHALGIALVTCGFSVKATAAVVLPFLVWTWAARCSGSPARRFVKATAASLAVFVPIFAVATMIAQVNLGWLKALDVTNLVVTWMSLPTAAAQLANGIAGIFTATDPVQFLSVARAIGWLLLGVLVARQWWLARSGDVPTVLRRASFALLTVVLLSPATLPWYFTWPLVMAAGFAWSGTGLAIGCGVSAWIMLSTYPAGSGGLYNFAYLALIAAVGVIAGASLLRPDPLRLSGRFSRLAGSSLRAPMVVTGTRTPGD
ncbi:MAG TPA: polyprenol phosphomannose-dependent alpha 1,6 mannosyltransferase MptB [Pseudonocardiaceae bacterium]|jgi:alpha-1,6-mannosyltransferase|nr:polyprenol phosphomannose-dependent alpha 1,6 mannosyltransferase MptB [Pseudonocardiaceae bacterium]